MLDTANDLIDQLLDGAVEALDIPTSLYEKAVAEYERVGHWLSAHADGSSEGWRVYPQGSFRLGTVVRPAGSDHYDLDAVCLRTIDRESTTQAQLKDEVGQALGRYVNGRASEPGAPHRCEPRKRCWTLEYPIAFHIDVLPAIPNPATLPSGILLTDTKLHAWQHSDPIAYANWFRQSMRRELLAKRTALAEAERIPPESVPEASVKTTLQRVVQVLKVHRNQFFASNLEMRPASILLSTLAAHAYEGERELAAAVKHTAQRIPELIFHDGGRWLIPNPVEPRENFADKWNDQPERAEMCLDWLRQLDADLHAAESCVGKGLDTVASRLGESFGREPFEKAATRLADRFREEREHGRLGFTAATGALGIGFSDSAHSHSGRIPVRHHDFYGE